MEHDSDNVVAARGQQVRERLGEDNVIVTDQQAHRSPGIDRTSEGDPSPAISARTWRVNKADAATAQVAATNLELTTARGDGLVHDVQTHERDAGHAASKPGPLSST